MLDSMMNYQTLPFNTCGRDTGPRALDHEELKKLCYFLNTISRFHYCKHTFDFTKAFTLARNIHFDEATVALQSEGGGCDCEIVMNVAYQRNIDCLKPNGEPEGEVVVFIDHTNSAVSVHDLSKHALYTQDVVAKQYWVFDHVPEAEPGKTWDAYHFSLDGHYLYWTTSEL